jgi:hypothetical protein
MYSVCFLIAHHLVQFTGFQLRFVVKVILSLVNHRLIAIRLKVF